MFNQKSSLLSFTLFFSLLIFGVILPDKSSATDKFDPNPNMNRVYVLNCGRIHNQSHYLNTGDKKHILPDLVRFAIPGYAIVKPNPCILVRKGSINMLWEAGIPDEVQESWYTKRFGQGPSKPGFLGPLVDILFRFYVDNPIENQLAKLNLKPEDIDILAVSHLHYDHSGNLNKFKNAKVYLRQEEINAATSIHFSDYNYTPEIYSSLLERPSQVFAISKEKHDVFGDGTVFLKKASGHTPGHQILELKLESGKKVATGDVYTSLEAYKKNQFAIYNSDRIQAEKTGVSLKKYIEKNNVKVWIHHGVGVYTDNILEAGQPIEGYEDLPFEKVFMGTDLYYSF